MNKYKLFFGISLLLAFLSFAYYEVRGNGYLERLDLNLIILLLIAKIFSLLINAIFNIELLKIFDVFLKFKEALYLSSITFLGNLFLPGRSGGTLRLIYLNRVHKLKKNDLISQFSYFFIISIFINTFFLIVCILTFYRKIDSSNSLFALVSLVLFAFSYFMLFFGFKENTKLNKYKFINSINGTKYSWQRIISRKETQTKLISLSFLNFSIFLIENMLILNILFNINDILTILFFNSSSTLGSLIGITPGSLGLKESFILFSSSFINLDLNQILSFSVVERGVSIIFSVFPVFVILNFVRKNRFNNLI